MPKKFIKSFKYAQEGMRHALRTQRNIWIHLLIGIAVIAAAAWLRVGLTEMAVLILTVSFVISAEMFNTAIEEAVNLAKPESHPLAGLAKNIAAAAVLIASIGSIIIGFLILIPRLVRW